MENKQPSTTLKVSTGVVKRAVKELEMYRKEVEEGENKLQTLPTNDNFYAQTQKALEESRTMLTRTQDRLKVSLVDLDSKMKGIAEGNPEFDEAVSWSQRARSAVAN
jgi:hypothetical protein